jgi:hypothetical protein
MTATISERASTNGRPVGRPLALEPPLRGRIRVPELALGLVVVAGCSLAAVLWQASSVERDPVLAVRDGVRRGEVLTADDVQVVYVSSDDPIGHLPEAQLGAVVGGVAATDMAAGTLLTADLVLDGAAVTVGEGVVGLALEPGQVPTPTLRPGDVVNVVAGPDAATSGEPVLVERAEVYAVEDLPAEGRVFVSLGMDEARANDVAAAAERGRVRLVLVSR